ncbi:MAG: MerR family DNA-binding transcriptional regulator [Actinobacteria bacterium]|nr:MerR family DNA-binding transcriptional regulator [Actinomycetota bacterium]
MPELVSTPLAAETIGVTARTLTRYVERGQITPAVILPSGHFRWDLDKLREQMDEVRRRRQRGR